MLEKEALIWYMYHSGFAVGTANHLLIFDYYKDSPESSSYTVASILQEMHDRDIVVFASHTHGDHFTPAIFEWKNKNANIKYVLSNDIKEGRDRDDATIVFPGHHYQVGSIQVTVLDSTDLGVAFLVSVDGITIFHAGDLNWWHWNGEPEKDNSKMAADYKRQIDQLRGKQLDLAFIPVDPRLEENYSLGLTYFMQVARTKMVFPMHFGRDYSIFQRLKKDLSLDHLRHIAVIAPSNRKFTYRNDGLEE